MATQNNATKSILGAQIGASPETTPNDTKTQNQQQTQNPQLTLISSQNNKKPEPKQQSNVINLTQARAQQSTQPKQTPVQGQSNKQAKNKVKAVAKEIFAEAIRQGGAGIPQASVNALKNLCSGMHPAQAASVLVSEIINTAQFDKEATMKLCASIPLIVGQENTETVAKEVEKQPTKAIETETVKDKAQDETKKKAETTTSVVGGIDASSATASSDVKVEEIKDMVSEAVKKELNASMEKLLEEIRKNGSATVGAAVASTGKSAEEVDKATLEQCKEKVKGLVESCEKKEAPKSTTTAQKPPAETPKPRKVEQPKPQQQSVQAESLAPAEQPVPPAQEVDHASLQQALSLKDPKLLQWYFGTCGLSLISGMPMFSFLGPVMWLGAVVGSFMYARECYSKYTSARIANGLTEESTGIKGMYTSKTFLVCGGGCFVASRIAWLSGLGMFLTFATALVGIGISAALYFVTHSVLKDSTSNASNLTRTSAKAKANMDRQAAEEAKAKKQAKTDEKKANRQEQQKQNVLKATRMGSK